MSASQNSYSFLSQVLVASHFGSIIGLIPKWVKGNTKLLLQPSVPSKEGGPLRSTGEVHSPEAQAQVKITGHIKMKKKNQVTNLQLLLISMLKAFMDKASGKQEQIRNISSEMEILRKNQINAGDQTHCERHKD